MPLAILREIPKSWSSWDYGVASADYLAKILAFVDERGILASDLEFLMPKRLIVAEAVCTFQLHPELALRGTKLIVRLALKDQKFREQDEGASDALLVVLAAFLPHYHYFHSNGCGRSLEDPSLIKLVLSTMTTFLQNFGKEAIIGRPEVLPLVLEVLRKLDTNCDAQIHGLRLLSELCRVSAPETYRKLEPELASRMLKKFSKDRGAVLSMYKVIHAIHDPAGGGVAAGQSVPCRVLKYFPQHFMMENVEIAPGLFDMIAQALSSDKDREAVMEVFRCFAGFFRDWYHQSKKSYKSRKARREPLVLRISQIMEAFLLRSCPELIEYLVDTEVCSLLTCISPLHLSNRDLQLRVCRISNLLMPDKQVPCFFDNGHLDNVCAGVRAALMALPKDREVVYYAMNYISKVYKVGCYITRPLTTLPGLLAHFPRDPSIQESTLLSIAKVCDNTPLGNENWWETRHDFVKIEGFTQLVLKAVDAFPTNPHIQSYVCLILASLPADKVPEFREPQGADLLPRMIVKTIETFPSDRTANLSCSKALTKLQYPSSIKIHDDQRVTLHEGVPYPETFGKLCQAYGSILRNFSCDYEIGGELCVAVERFMQKNIWAARQIARGLKDAGVCEGLNQFFISLPVEELLEGSLYSYGKQEVPVRSTLKAIFALARYDTDGDICRRLGPEASKVCIRALVAKPAALDVHVYKALHYLAVAGQDESLRRAGYFSGGSAEGGNTASTRRAAWLGGVL